MSEIDFEKMFSLLEALTSLDRVIVEGVNDKKSLESFGVSRIITVKRRAIYKVVESIPKGSRIAILTDLDSEGKKIYSMLNKEFSQRGVHIDNKLRDFLFKNTDLRQIEGLKRFVERRCLTLEM
ncbi:toprim domain-containing protein [Candidatus Woesearchaeota archaeon]|nr:toprim domain-containing protein [Candidatus Woesearchaeota archaeon]